MSSTYDPLIPSPVPEEKVLPLDLVPAIAKRTARKFDLNTFRAVYTLAVKNGLISEQEIDQRFGEGIRRKLQSPKTNPNPAQCREILLHIATLDPEQAKREKLPWRHANQRPKEELAL